MPSDPFDKSFDNLVDQALARWHMSGVAFSVVHGSETYSKGYGLADQSAKTPVETSTLFYCASTTKAQLCAAWALYIDSKANKSKPKDQQISFSTPLAEIIRDDFVVSDPYRTSHVTIEDCVSHRTGLPRHELCYGYEGVKTTKDITRNLRHLPFRTPLRSEFEYCNTPFVAASHALEVLTGKPLAQYLRETLWDPLKMESTYGGYDEASRAIKDKGLIQAKGYSWTKISGSPDEADGELAEEMPQGLEEISGAGYVISTVDDYAKWMRALLDPSTGPLSQENIDELFKSRTVVPESDHDATPFEGVLTYALGWFPCTYRGHMVYWHTGGLTGGGALIVIVPSLKWGCTYLSNGDNPGMKLKGLTAELLDAALGVPEAERTALKRSDESVLKVYRKMDEAFKNGKKKLYPNAPDKPNIYPSLAIEDYAGTFRNVAYGPLTFEVAKDGSGMLCNITDRTWGNRFDIEHVNAECWIVTRGQFNRPLKDVCRAESKIGADGKVQAWGVAMEPSLPDHLFWFEKEQ